MIRKVYILIVSIFGSLEATAQTLDNLKVVDDSIRLSYTIPVGDISADENVILRPVLRSDSDSVCLAEHLVRGRRDVKRAHREYVLSGAKKRGEVEPAYIIYKDKRQGVSDSAALLLNEYKWAALKPVSICVERVKMGCCRVDTLTAICSLPEKSGYEEPPIVVAIPDKQDTVPVDIAKVDSAVIHTDPVIPTIPDISPIASTAEDYKPYDPKHVVSTDTSALYVYFKTDKINIERGYMGNAQRLDSIEHLVAHLTADSTREVQTIRIIGLASIEGNDSHNQWLGLERANAMKRYIQQHSALPDSCFEIINGGEAWNEVVYFVENHKFNGAEEVLRIINNVEEHDKREVLLRKLNGGATFKYLHDAIFRELRYSAYLKVYFRRKK